MSLGQEILTLTMKLSNLSTMLYITNINLYKNDY